MSHDNTRFNVSGDSPEALTATLRLWSLLHGPMSYGHSRFPPPELDFEGYCLHPQYGMVLYIYGEDPKMERFPFEEGKSAERLTTFFYNYLSSSKSEVNDDMTTIAKQHYMSEDEVEAITSDFSWDRDADHDGSNERHWRVMTFRWGRVLGSNAPLAIRPAYCWYGK